MSLSAVFVTLPYPPSANMMWRHVGKKVLRSAAYEKWRAACSLIIRAETRGNGISGPYAMTVLVGRPDRRRRDIDNLLKPVGDVLVLAGAVADDSDCQAIDARWVDSLEGVRVTLLETAAVEPFKLAAKAAA